MPVTILETQDRSSRLMRTYQHDCSLGELQHQLTLKIMNIFMARAKEKKERVNWHDLFQAACEELANEGIIKVIPWQILGTDTLFPQGFIQAVRGYNADPEKFKFQKMVPEKLDEPE